MPLAIANMKVLLVHNSYQRPGGEDVAFKQECELLERHGHDVLTYRRSNLELQQLATIERLTLVRRVIAAEDSRLAVLQILRNEKPDLIHVHNTFMMISPSIYQACREAQVPVLQTLHNFRLLCPASIFFRDGRRCEECVEHSLWRGVWHGCYRDSHTATAIIALMLQWHRARGTWDESVDGYIALSDFSRKKFVDGGLPAEKISVKPNFVYPDPGERNAPGHYGLFVGRLSAEKGLSTLLTAWQHSRSSIPLVIVGDGPLRVALEAQAAKNGQTQVTFRGWLNPTETRAAMKQAAFLVLPSVCYENFPMTITESFACGTPVLCSRLGAMQELVADQHTGLHFTPGDAEDLASKLEWASDHPSELGAMGREARREYEARYTPEQNYSHLMNIYEQALNAHA
jgi:glycosyltransferase involved in cell wall biosynthesis